MEGHWCFQLKELDGGRTRLVINGYQATRPRWFERFYNYWVYGPVVWSMHVRMLAVLKRNVERTARTPARTQSQPAKQRACNPAVPNDVRLAIPAAGTHSLRLDADWSARDPTPTDSSTLPRAGCQPAFGIDCGVVDRDVGEGAVGSSDVDERGGCGRNSRVRTAIMSSVARPIRTLSCPDQAMATARSSPATTV